ncbi:MAG TPA: flagellin FliC [Nitrospina sp.]|jgi:flagellin|nr:flagellin FliC [Nitrospina sp.]|tara:strand:+ start:214 stop:1077 length:864 start_codon:yes stop_codon:yes gene_type:complete
MVALALNTNLSSLNAQRHLENNRSQLGSSINRISSGRIEGASDGVTELTLTENIRADVVALQQGSRNLNDGTALVKTAEGALNEISGILLRLRSIASQSANGTIDDVERISTDLEYQASLRELDRIVATTEFNGTFLLDGTLAASQPAADHNVLQLGVDSSSNNQFDLNNMLNLTNVGTASLGLSGSNITSQGDAFQALNALTTSIDDLIQARGRVGTTQIRIMHAFDNLKVQEENLTAAVSTIRDADFAEELTSLTKNQLLVQSAVAMVGQANLNPQAALTLLEGV